MSFFALEVIEMSSMRYVRFQIRDVSLSICNVKFSKVVPNLLRLGNQLSFRLLQLRIVMFGYFSKTLIL